MGILLEGGDNEIEKYPGTGQGAGGILKIIGGKQLIKANEIGSKKDRGQAEKRKTSEGNIEKPPRNGSGWWGESVTGVQGKKTV